MGHGRPGQRHLPQPARPNDRWVRRERAALAAEGGGQSGRSGAGADRGLVPAVPEPLHGRPRVRRRWRAVRHRRRRGELQLRRLRAVGLTAQSLRGPTERSGRQPDSAERRRRGAAQPGRTHDRRRDRAQRHDHPGRSGDGFRATRQPSGGAHRRRCAADHRLRVPQSIPTDDQARDQRALDRGRRVGDLGGDQPHPQAAGLARELRLALLRGKWLARAATTGWT